MADYKQINAGIWNDEWFSELEPRKKLLFIYLSTNNMLDHAGSNKVAMAAVSFETGLSVDFIKSAMSEFSRIENANTWVKDKHKSHTTTTGSDEKKAHLAMAKKSKIRNSKSMYCARKRIIKKRGFACEMCGYDGGRMKYLVLHHIKPHSEGGDLSDENLLLLCEKCHADQHAYKKKTFLDMDCRRYHYGI